MKWPGTTTMFAITFAAKTDVGRVRTQNQDSLITLIAPDLEGLVAGLFVVADGIGGGNSGDIASHLTVQTVRASILADLKAASPADSTAASSTTASSLTVDTLLAAVQTSLKAANTIVWKQGRQVSGQRGMGTTCVLALLHKDSLILGNVGDSRAYRLRSGQLEQLTTDHAFLDAGRGARNSDHSALPRVHFRHVMTRAIGFTSVVEPEVEAFALLPGDAYLLCSDGLSNLLSATEIATLLAAHDTPQTTCDRLVAAANRNGGDDNITVIVLHYGIAASDTPAKAGDDAHSPVSEREAVAAPPQSAVNSWRKRWHRWTRNLFRIKAN